MNTELALQNAAELLAATPENSNNLNSTRLDINLDLPDQLLPAANALIKTIGGIFQRLLELTWV